MPISNEAMIDFNLLALFDTRRAVSKKHVILIYTNHKMLHIHCSFHHPSCPSLLRLVWFSTLIKSDLLLYKMTLSTLTLSFSVCGAWLDCKLAWPTRTTGTTMRSQ